MSYVYFTFVLIILIASYHCTAFEFFDRESLDIELKHMTHVRDPLSQPHPFYVLVETSGSNEAHDSEVGIVMMCVFRFMYHV